MTHAIERRNARSRSEWSLFVSPAVYADSLARYMRDASTIIAHTKREFGGRAPDRAAVEQMIALHNKPTLEVVDDGYIDRMIERAFAPVVEPAPPAPEPVFQLPEVIEDTADLFQVRLLKAVAHDFEIEPQNITGKDRHKRFVYARAVVIFILRERNPVVWSFPQIGKLLGGRDHSTILNLWWQRDDLLRRHELIAACYAKRKALV